MKNQTSMNHISIHLIEYLSFMIILIGMVGASELLGDREIIFPEVAALAIGCFLSPRLSWKVNPTRMLSCITICAILGVCIVRYLPLPLWIQFSFAFFIGQIILWISGTTFVPMISAIALPVLIQTESLVYIIAAIILTLSIILIRILLEKMKIKQTTVFQKHIFEKKDYVILVLARTCCIMAAARILFPQKIFFCLAPPLLVAFTELSNGKGLTMKKGLRIIGLVSLCAFSGALMRWLVTMRLGLPLTLSAIFVGCLTILWIRIFDMYLPPAGAMGILAMLIKEEAVYFYPFQVLAGISGLVFISIIMQILLNHLSSFDTKEHNQEI